MKDLLTEDDYIKILQNKYGSKNIQYISSEWKDLDEIEGFMGDHFFLSIKFKENNNGPEKIGKFFIKTKPKKTEIQKTVTDKYNIYRKEIFIYNFLLKEFDKMGLKTDFAAKSYLCKNEETIVMDDMGENGFELLDRGTFMDFDHLKLALEGLAKYHANGICYEEQKSKELGRPYRFGNENPGLFEEMFYIRGDRDSESYRFIKASKDLYMDITKIMPESEEWKKLFATRMEKLDLAEIFWKEFPYRKTICHGDLWSNNMMFKYQSQNGTKVPKECCLLDFQLIRHFYPSFDPLLLIYSNTGKEFRDKNMENLLNYYYECFQKILEENGYDAGKIYPKEHFLEVADSIRIVPLFQGACTRTITLLPKDITTDAVNSGGDDLENLFFEDKRTRLVLEGCKRDEKFRKIIFDDIYDIEKLLK